MDDGVIEKLGIDKIKKIDSYKDMVLQSPKLAIMSAKIKEHGNEWNEGSVTEHNDEMMGILEKEIRKN